MRRPYPYTLIGKEDCTMNKIQLTSDVPIQTRRAQRIDEDTGKALEAACHGDDRIQACYLLDARKQGSVEEFLIIAITAEDRDFESVAVQFHESLPAFPTRLPETYIKSSAGIDACSADSRFYIKTAEQDGAEQPPARRDLKSEGG